MALFTVLSFSHQRKLMDSHKSLNDSKSPQISRTFLSILANLNIVGTMQVSILPLISKSFILEAILW